MKISLAVESDPTDRDDQLLNSSTNPLNIDSLPWSIHLSKGDMLI
jgi:hypothetical protein